MKIAYITPTTSYSEAISLQEAAVAECLDTGNETLFFVEHAPVYTCGTSANPDRDVLGTHDIPLVQTGRGGQITYHGPGQRVLYPILDLRVRGRDIRKYIQHLQQWIIETLATFDIHAHSDDDVGVWVSTSAGDKKIAAIGVRVRKWVTFHGVALNVCPDMDHFSGIVPCGITQKGVTSMRELGFNGNIDDVDRALLDNFEGLFRAPLSNNHVA